MKICGVICEYNPFHNGHKYMIDRAREQSGCDFLVCVMSGNFTQRGEPAVSDKFSRAEYAVRGGADAVIELPAAFAVSPAELFAKGGVKLLSSIPDFTALAFGAESGTAQSFAATARALSEESRELKAAVKEKLKTGLSPVRARAEALEQISPPEVDMDLLNSPNNILGIEYQKALFQFECGAQILPIPRVGAGYTDTKQYADYSSAAAIRKAAEDKKYRFIRRNVPEYVFRDVKNFTSPALYEKIAVYSVMSKPASELKKIADCTEGLENRIQALAKDNPDYGALIEKITTKRYISSRIRRIFAASVLNITEELIRQSLKNKLYLKILAVDREKAADILAALKKSQFPLIARRSDLAELAKTAQALIEKDFQANEVYQLATGKKFNDNAMRLV